MIQCIQPIPLLYLVHIIIPNALYSAQTIGFEEKDYIVLESDEGLQVCVIADATGTPSETREVAFNVSTMDGTARGKSQSSNAVVV